MTYIKFPEGLVMETTTPEAHPSAVVLTKAEAKEAGKEYARKQLMRLVPEGSRVYTILRHVSSSGMTRHIDLYIMKDDRPVYLSGYASELLGYKRATKGNYALIVGGCGMDMGWHLVYRLSSALYNDGYNLRHEWL